MMATGKIIVSYLNERVGQVSLPSAAQIHVEVSPGISVTITPDWEQVDGMINRLTKLVAMRKAALDKIKSEAEHIDAEVGPNGFN